MNHAKDSTKLQSSAVCNIRSQICSPLLDRLSRLGCKRLLLASGLVTLISAELVFLAMSKRPTDDLEPSAKRGKRGSDRQLTKDDPSDDEDGPVKSMHSPLECSLYASRLLCFTSPLLPECSLS